MRNALDVETVAQTNIDDQLSAIQTIGLTRKFGDRTAVDGIDLIVHPGELFSLLGPNGAGKTTMIKLLCCLLKPTGGTASVFGHGIRSDTLGVKKLIALSPQETAIAEHLTARENLRLMAGLHGLSAETVQMRSDELLEVMGLTERADDKAKKFSGGMKRRLSIAMALVSRPHVLFLDEPTLGLDPQARRGMWEHIAGLKGKTTVVLTTHYLEEADALADRIAIIDEGRIVAEGSPAALKAELAPTPITMVMASDLNAKGVAALRNLYPAVQSVPGGVEISGDDVRLYDIEDCLRPLGVTIESTYRKQVTLDDVFLHLTGKQLRE